MNIKKTCRNGLMCFGGLIVLMAFAMGLDAFAERRFVQEIKEERLNGLRVEDAVARFRLRATKGKRDDFYGLMRVRRLSLFWRVFGCDDRIEAYVVLKDGAISGVLTVMAFPSMSPVYPIQ